MVVYSFYIFDRHAECIYKKKWLGSSLSARPSTSSSSAQQQQPPPPPPPNNNSQSSSGPGSQRPDSQQRPQSVVSPTKGAPGGGGGEPDMVAPGQQEAFSAEDDAKLVFGTVYSLRNLVRKLGGEEDNFVSYRTSHYKLHYYETPTSLKFVMVTDTRTNNLRIVLHQIYVSLYVEYVVKNPLSPPEHPGGVGVNCEMFEYGLEQFINGSLQG